MTSRNLRAAKAMTAKRKEPRDVGTAFDPDRHQPPPTTPDGKWAVHTGDFVVVFNRQNTPDPNPTWPRPRSEIGRGIVLAVDHKLSEVTVDGVNLREFPTQESLADQTPNAPIEYEERPMAVHLDQCLLIDPLDKEPTTAQWLYTDDGRRVRVSDRTDAVIPRPPRRRGDGPKSRSFNMELTTSRTAVADVTYQPPEWSEELRRMEARLRDEAQRKADAEQAAALAALEQHQAKKLAKRAAYDAQLAKRRERAAKRYEKDPLRNGPKGAGPFVGLPAAPFV